MKYSLILLMFYGCCYKNSNLDLTAFKTRCEDIKHSCKYLGTRYDSKPLSCLVYSATGSYVDKSGGVLITEQDLLDLFLFSCIQE